MAVCFRKYHVPSGLHLADLDPLLLSEVEPLYRTYSLGCLTTNGQQQPGKANRLPWPSLDRRQTSFLGLLHVRDEVILHGLYDKLCTVNILPEFLDNVVDKVLFREEW